MSVTDLTVADRGDLDDVAAKGLALAGAWPELDGAIGLWMWAKPEQGRSGAVAVWRDHTALLGFVRWPVHVAIMREYRDRGSLRSTTWTTERFVADETVARAERWLA